jgi:hypothetical protein
VDNLDNVPSFGCTGSGLGCLDADLIGDQPTLKRET